MKDNRIEDFFNNSLESFNDAPTDAVWAGLANRLDEEKTTPFYKKSLFILGVLGLLLLAFGGCTWYNMNSKIEALMSENLFLKNENTKHQKSLVLCQNNSQTLTLNQNKQPLSINTAPPVISFDNKNVLSKKENKANYPELPLAIDTLSQVTKSAKTHPVAEVEMNNRNDVFSKKLFISEEQKFSFLHEIEKDKNIGRLSYNTIHNTSNPVLPNLKKFNPYKSSKNQFGLEIGAFIVKTDLLKANGIRNQLDLGQSIELNVNQRIWNRFKVISGLGYVNYKYRANQTIMNRPFFATFPSLPEQTGLVEQVEVTNQLLNFSLGFQYDFTSYKNSTLFFKSSANWKMYLPQSFKYSLSTGAFKDYAGHRYFLYFGSLDIAFGIENMFKNGQSYQLELFAEGSLIPLGLENVNTNNFGIKASILLDKKP